LRARRLRLRNAGAGIRHDHPVRQRGAEAGLSAGSCARREDRRFALTEPGSGSDVAAIETTASESEGGYRVEGAKTYISNGGIADYYILFARTGEAPGAKGISAFIVDRQTEGLDDSERIDVIAPHPLATLRFTTCAFPRPRSSASAARASRRRWRRWTCSEPPSAPRRSASPAVLWTRRPAARSRAASEQATLADNPITQSKLAEMVLDVDASALLIYRAAWLRDVQGQRNSREAALAKLHATDSAQSVIDKAVQIFGGLGVTHGVPVERLYREIRALRIYEGASEVQKVVIARAHLADYRR
jgi:acyl-CoA dehydrogenase